MIRVLMVALMAVGMGACASPPPTDSPRLSPRTCAARLHRAGLEPGRAVVQCAARARR